MKRSFVLVFNTGFFAVATNWVHLHLALNHVPVLGTVFVTFLLVTAIAKRSDELVRLSLIWFVVLTVVSIPIKFTGDFAYESTSERAWMLQDLANAHEEAADQATTGIFLLGIVAAVGTYFSWRHGSAPRWTVILALLLAVITILLMARAANLGGQIRHEEIRPARDAAANSQTEPTHVPFLTM